MRHQGLLVVLLLGLAAGTAHAQTADPQAPVTEGSADWAALKAQAEAQTAAYNAAKAAAEARTAMIAAQTAAARAAVGEVTGQTAIEGTTDAGTGGKPEAILLIARSAESGAAQIHADLQATLTSRSVMILTDIAQLSSADALQFDLQRSEVGALINAARGQFAAAGRTAQLVPDEDEGTDRGAFLTEAGAVIEAVSKLGSYFQSSYTFEAVEAPVPEQLTSSAIISQFRRAGTGTTFIVPANLVTADAGPLVAELAPLQREYVLLAGEAAEAKARGAKLKSREGADAQAAAAMFEAAEGSATRALAAYEAMRTALLTPSPNGDHPAARILRQRAIQRALSGANPPLILLVTHKEAAALYTQRSLWTFLGGPPLHTMGGIVMTYSLFDHRTGEVLQSGVAARHGGYRSVNDVERLFPMP